MKKIFVSLLLLTTLPSAFADDAKTPFQKVFDVISSPQILHKSLQKTLQDLNGLCKKSTKSEAEQKNSGNVECVQDVGIDSLFINGETPDAIDEITLQFHGDDKSAYVKNILVKNFGAHPDVKNGELSWWPKKHKKSDPQSFVNFTNAKGTSYFTFGNESDAGDGEG